MKIENWIGVGIIGLAAYVVYKVNKGLNAVGDGIGAGAGAVGSAVADTATSDPLATDPSENTVGMGKPKTRTVTITRTINVRDPFKDSYIPKGFSGSAVQIGKTTTGSQIFSTNVAGQPSFVRDFGNKMSVFNYQPVSDQTIVRSEQQTVIIPTEKTFSNSLKAGVSSLVHQKKLGTSTTVTYGPTGIKTIVKKLVTVKQSKFK